MAQEVPYIVPFELVAMYEQMMAELTVWLMEELMADGKDYWTDGKRIDDLEVEMVMLARK